MECLERICSQVGNIQVGGGALLEQLQALVRWIFPSPISFYAEINILIYQRIGSCPKPLCKNRPLWHVSANRSLFLPIFKLFCSFSDKVFAFYMRTLFSWSFLPRAITAWYIIPLFLLLNRLFLWERHSSCLCKIHKIYSFLLFPNIICAAFSIYTK